MSIERLSVEVTNRCAKACHFCYAHSGPAGATSWAAAELVAFAADCAAHGVCALSLGGGEPLQADATFHVLAALRGVMFRSVTTNGLLLDGPALDRLVDVGPDKVHVSIHFPDDEQEVARVVRQVGALADRGVTSGVNLVVARSGLAAATWAARQLRAAGIGADRVVYLPMRGADTPSPAQLAAVAFHEPFQSMTCLSACARSARFASVTWDKRAAWCSYTTAKRPLRSLDHAGLVRALDGLDVVYCGGADATA